MIFKQKPQAKILKVESGSSVLPFLLLGIGIDDMFVIVQCFNTLTKEENKLSHEGTINCITIEFN